VCVWLYVTLRGYAVVIGCRVEVHATNETCTYLMKLVHEIGLELRSSAVCTGLRRLRYGHFALSHALLTKHTDARSLAENIEFCRPAIEMSLAEQRSETVRTDRLPDTISTLDQWKISKSSMDDDSSMIAEGSQPFDETTDI